MKKIHLTLLLAGLLAVGSAFSSKQKFACEGLDVKKVTDLGEVYPLTEPGTCTGERESCTLGYNTESKEYDIPCDEENAFIRSTN